MGEHPGVNNIYASVEPTVKCSTYLATDPHFPSEVVSECSESLHLANGKDADPYAGRIYLDTVRLACSNKHVCSDALVGGDIPKCLR